MVIDEFQFIRSLADSPVSRQASNVVLHGIGDDCAVLRKDADSVYLISTDCLVEGIHFSFDYFSAYDLGWKSLAVNLSDIAAMCGRPECVFASLAIPRDTRTDVVDQFYLGLSDLASTHGVKLAGGDTSASLSGWFINITIVGTARNNQYKLRSGARPGDVIAVTGTFGDSALGLKQLQSDAKSQGGFVQRHRRPEPRIEAARILGEHEGIHAVIDVSDGLIQDLRHIARASRVSMVLQEVSVPVLADFILGCEFAGIDPMETKLSGGEDYELAVCLASDKFDFMRKRMSQDGICFTRIGDVVEQGGREDVHVDVIGLDGSQIAISWAGYDHFKRR